MNKIAYPLVTSIGLIAILLLYSAGFGYQRGMFGLGLAFELLTIAAYAGIAAAVLSLIYIFWQRPQGLKLVVIIVSCVLGLTAFYLPYRQQQLAAQVPPIHDITTDTVNPPAFVAVAPLRAAAPNPATYDGMAVASQQREAYPDLQPVVYRKSQAEVFSAAARLVEDRGWELVTAEPGEGRIEATATTRWFGFKDDVVIRIADGAEGATVFDMRSKSRVGVSDIGVNASRIRAFIAELDKRLQ